MAFGPRATLYYSDAIAAADGVVTVADEVYIEAGTTGIIVDVFHTASGAATATYVIEAVPFTDDQTDWAVTSLVPLLTSAAIAKDTNVRLVVDPRVAAVSNTHASTVLPWQIKVTCDVGTADASAVFVSITQVS